LTTKSMTHDPKDINLMAKAYVI